ncbi:response regulator transcription factor [Streptomyces sp. NPDC052721]|uniref:response regulator n=1 Tax=Streptomyces sp. NPDC052721 TaxID=3154955 RepID=UPI003426DEBD
MLAEDSVLLREGLIGLLSRCGHEVVAAVGDAQALIAAVEEHAPDIVVTDVRMPPGFQDEGLHAAVRLREQRPTLPVLVLSQYVQRTYAAELLDSGDGSGVGYLLKDRVGQVEEFVEALREVADGGTVVDPAAGSTQLRAGREWAAERRVGVAPSTPRGSPAFGDRVRPGRPPTGTFSPSR